MARPLDDGFGGSGGGGAPPGGARHAAFKAAYRHSRRVKLLRRIIPVVSVFAVLGVVGVSAAQRLAGLSLPISIAGLSISGSRVAMEAPRLAGYTDDNRSYRVSARRAETDIRRTNQVVDLFGITAELGLADGGLANLVAVRGAMEPQAQRVEMFERIQVSTTTGYSGETTRAVIDVRAGTLVVDARVDLRGPGGKMNADRMQVRDNGRVLVFEGNVEGDFTPEAAEPREPIVPDDAPVAQTAPPRARGR